MSRSVYLFILALCVFSCKNKEVIEPLKITKSLSNNIYNLAGKAEIAKLPRDIVRFEDTIISKTYSFSSNYRQHFIAITFPFSFYVNKIYVNKGDHVKKGEKLFEITSDNLNTALSNYRKTGDESLALRIKNAGIDLDSSIPITAIFIVAPKDGTIHQIKVQEKENYRSQEIAVIQLDGDLVLEGFIPSTDYTDDITFSALLGNNNEISANVIETNTSGTLTKIRLSAQVPIAELNNDKISVKTKKLLKNVFKINKSSVWLSENTNWIFIDKGDGIVEKREVKGFYENDNFVITEGVFENEMVFKEGINMILRYIS